MAQLIITLVGERAEAWAEHSKHLLLQYSGRGIGPPVATANLRRNFTLAIINGTNAPELLIGGSASDFIRGFGGDDVLVGLEGNDVLVGDSGIDQIGGGVGNDVLVGGIGFDKLVGGTEADTFRYLSTADSGVGILGSSHRDIIADFVHGQDKIDLEAVDAKFSTTDNQAFTFIGSAPFTAEGQVRVVTEGDHTLVQMNTFDGLGAESAIELTGNIDITVTDFLL